MHCNKDYYLNQLEVLTLSKSVSSYAGLHGLTAHSRSNCVNNESIIWHAGCNYWMRVISFHNYKHAQQHVLDTFRTYTWRGATVCWGEAPKGQGDPWDIILVAILKITLLLDAQSCMRVLQEV